MPIVEPQSFNALNLIPFQINPHYTDALMENHAGETREDRILEYLAANQEDTVLGLREGCMFHVEGSSMKLIGDDSVRLFRYQESPTELDKQQDFSSFLR